MNISWLLFKRSGKSNRNRLALTAGAVSLGVLMVLTFAAGVNALFTRNEYSNWRTNFSNNPEAMQSVKDVSPLKVSLTTEGNLNKFQNTTISVTSLHATGDNSPQLPGIPTPQPGEYYVSRGLQKIIQENADANIGARFGTKQIGLIPDTYVSSPDALDVIRGMSLEEAANPSVASVYTLSSVRGVSPYTGMVAALLVVGATILFVPIVIFLIIATQLGSVQREQRYAALRLVGATRKQISQIITFESSMAALAGIALGSVLFLVLRAPLAHFYFDGRRFWEADITVSLLQYVIIIATVLALCIGANWWGMRRVQLSPLGVARKQIRAKRPHILSLLPLGTGLAIYAWASTFGREWVLRDMATTGLPMVLLFAGIIFVMGGLLMAGPYLTRRIAGFIATRTKNATTLIAAKRIQTQFKQVFRSVSGVVLALFAASFYLTAVSGIEGYSRAAVQENGYSQLLPGTAVITGDGLPSDFAERLRSQPYITGVVSATQTNAGTAIPCGQVAAYTKLACTNDQGFAVIDFDAPSVAAPQITAITAADAQPEYLVKIADANIDKLRSFVAANTPQPLATVGGTYVVSGTYAQQAIVSPLITELAGLAYVGIGVTLLIAIASLMVSTVGGFLERQRSFATLRLGGMNIQQMRRTVLLESLLPLFCTALLSAAIGCWIGYVFIEALGNTLQVSLHPSYLAIVGGSLVLAVAAIHTTLPLLNTLTRPEANQTE